VDKNVARFTGTITITTGAGTEAIITIPHGQGQALLPVGYFRSTISNITVSPNYQNDAYVFNVSCDATNIKIAYYVNFKPTPNPEYVSYIITLVAK
jgi:hypothetical protein